MPWWVARTRLVDRAELVDRQTVASSMHTEVPTPAEVTVSERLAPLMQRVADQALELVAGADGVMIGLGDREGVSYLWASGLDRTHVGTRVKLDTSLSGIAMKTRRVVRCDDTATDPRVDADACRRHLVGSSVCIPLLRSNKILGLLAISARTAHAFDDNDIATATWLADFASVALDLARDQSWTIGPGLLRIE
jgi:GAF domain-containing protein